jgi:hypothetical protein
MDERPDTPEDEKTPWISTSADLLWCIYEVCRRLICLERKVVYITIIRHPHEANLKGGNDNETAGERELLVEPYSLLKLNHHQVKDLLLSVGIRENYDLAARACRYSSERLFWGRIFSESVLYNLEFDFEVSVAKPCLV